LIFLDPPLDPADLGKYYPADYNPYNPSASLRTSALGNFLRSVLVAPYSLRYGVTDWVEKPFGSGQLLDVGCGAGMFLKEASRIGWRTTGIDFSPTAIEVARKNVAEARLQVATLDTLPTDWTGFDLINLSHVLEHLAEPRRALEQCCARLASGGRLRIVVPEIGGFESAFFGRSWIGLDVPRHLVHFRRAVLVRLLKETGFAEVTARPTMFASSISESLILTLRPSLRYRALHSRFARVLYLSMIFPASLSYLCGNSGAMEVLARKR
jgi:SAM-dependent methyltransferase